MRKLLLLTAAAPALMFATAANATVTVDDTSITDVDGPATTGTTTTIGFTEAGLETPTFTEWLTGLLPVGDDFFSDETGSFGAFLNALIAFLIMAAVVYFFIVLPYTKAKERFFPSEESGTPADVAVLEEIRDLLKARGGAV